MWVEIVSTTDLKNATLEICQYLEGNGVPKEKIFDCRLVVNELVGNVLRHSEGKASVKGNIKDGCIEIFVRSTQAFIPPTVSVCSPTTAEGGRGLYLVDSVSISRTVTPDGEIKVVIQY